MDGMQSGVLHVPAPILTRVIQELGNGLLKYHEAKKLYAVLFPVPYLLALKLMLFFFFLLTPMVATLWTPTIFWAAFFAFLLVFTFFALDTLADNLDNPFDAKTHFDPSMAQGHLNRSLLEAVREAASPLATLSPDAQIESAVAMRIMRKVSLADVV